MIKVIAEKHGEVVKHLGDCETLDEAKEIVSKADGPDPMNDPQWPEGCDAVAVDVTNGRSYYLECGAWCAYE